MPTILSLIIIGIIALIIYLFRELLSIIAGFFLLFAGIGALIGWLAFDAASTGAAIGCGVAAFVSIRYVMDEVGARYASAFMLLYYIISFPIWFANRIQHIVVEPWRYIFKLCSLSEATRNTLRPVFEFIQVLLYIAITPLRVANAVVYNIFVYGLLEFYDLIMEVLQPGDYDEGYGDWWVWTYMLPWRLLKYPIFHGILVLLDGIFWTVMDTLIPAITMYHGTDLNAAQAITGKYGVIWTDGTFSASTGGWAGRGVYFGSSRKTARRYALDPTRLGDNNPVMIVCRVSLGKILNYNLAPYDVYYNTGEKGNANVINRYCDKNGYTTGEWWNGLAGYWEYCMLDWQNRYNHPWRIRPVYIFNFRTGRIQHIEGGIRHWLFSRESIDEILNEKRLLVTAIVSAIISISAIIYAVFAA